MSSYMTGVSLGIRLSKYIPRKIGLGAGILLFAFIGWAVYDSFADKAHYNKLRTETENIFAAEQKYFAKKGDYTADLRLLDFELPPSSSEVNYSASRYVHDAGEAVLTPEKFTFTLGNGDSFLVNVFKELNYTEEGKTSKYSLLEIHAFPKFKTLRASYSIRRIYDGYCPAGQELLKQCNVMIQNADKAEDDIKKGGKFCSRMGANPTNIDLIWLF
ncbi:hypothetical protein [Candidatus Proelusimicrobium excrementi]|uniref:hypothetical protein n=1 Tax=Candidatus Proelusimicrobium excrementi TaxID=3416222 RepID=UPI003D09BA22